MKRKKHPRIADNPSYRKLQEQAKGVEALLKLRPLLKLLGAELPEGLEEKAASLALETQRLTSLPDRFNDLFGSRGWVAYEMLKQDVMERVVELGEAGDVDAAEEVLVEHFDRETLGWGIKFMFAHPAFHPRERLLQLAMEDHLAGRYHASIPVVLMMIDGFVNDVSKSKGAFAEGTELVAWDSVAAHASGLQVLKSLWTKGRTKTTEEAIAVPYRHGILHGRDLAYDNRLVSSKAWACLFALREWSIAVRDDTVEEPPPEKEPGLLQTLFRVGKQRREIEELRAVTDRWTARTEEELSRLPKSGGPEDYDEGSPERAIAEVMLLWSRGNYGHMARFLRGPFDPIPQSKELGKLAGDLRELFDSTKLLGYRVEAIEDTAPAIAHVKLTVKLQDPGGECVEKTHDVYLVHLDEQGELLPCTSAGGAWVMPYLRMIPY